MVGSSKTTMRALLRKGLRDLHHLPQAHGKAVHQGRRVEVDSHPLQLLFASLFMAP